MIVKVIKGRSFVGAATYAYKGDGQNVIGGNMAGITPREWSKRWDSFADCARLWTGPLHTSSFPPRLKTLTLIRQRGAKLQRSFSKTLDYRHARTSYFATLIPTTSIST